MNSRTLFRFAATSRISKNVIKVKLVYVRLAMPRLEQCFRPRDLPPQIDLIDPTDDPVLLSVLPGQGARVLLPERRQSVCVEMVWGGGIPATDALWERDLNESLRLRRCLIPTHSSKLVAGLVAWCPPLRMEVALTLGVLDGDSLLSGSVPLEVAHHLGFLWLHGTAADHLIRLLEFHPPSRETGLFARYLDARWEHVPIGEFPEALARQTRSHLNLI